MDKETRERFERIEANLERTGERMNQFHEGMIELEAMQKSTTIALNRFVDESQKRGAEVDERIANLAILVDQLVKKNLNGGH